MSKSHKPIHPEIKKSLGFNRDISDREFLKVWRKKSTQVCKPCWELKYCPYGPFVEQSPLLPTLKAEAIEQNEYFEECLKTNKIGSKVAIDKERIEEYREILRIVEKHPRFLLPVVLREKYDEDLIKEGAEKGLEIHEIYKTPLNDFEKYDLPFPLSEKKTEVLKELEKIELTDEIKDLIKKEIQRYKRSIETGVDDYTKPLDSVRKKFFENAVNKFDPEKHPEEIPEQIRELSCNIFGHICPVVFVGESITETSEKRRKGRYIPFKIKVRVVRRDNYTCQICSCHLRDDEVEFDHRIPISKGGSSEEHNIRLTCYKCNRDKFDKIEI